MNAETEKSAKGRNFS